MKRLLFFFICSLFIFPVNAEIPIIAFSGIPVDQCTPDRFKEFREAGFDVSITYCGNKDVHELKAILDIAQKQKVKMLIFSTILNEHPEAIAPVLKNHQALFGYTLQDEPTEKDFPKLKTLFQKIRSFDKNAVCYINLLPNCGVEIPGKEGNGAVYNRYLQQASTIGAEQISFDNYPILKTGIRDFWYRNLESIRQESLRTGRPFWAFVLCTPHYHYPQPDLASLRLQIYSNLAYGAKAIQYFTYWTPQPYQEYDYHNGPISLDGKRTSTYELVKLMNQELHSILPLFDGAEIVSVNHLLRIPNGTSKLKSSPLNINSLKVIGRKGAIVSTMNKNGHKYMLIVNKDHMQSMRLLIKAKNTVRQITKNLSEVAVKESYTLSGGDMLIFRLQ